MSKKSTKRPMLIAFFTIFLDLLGFGIVIPVNSFYIESLGAGPVAIAMLSASYSLMQFIFSPFWGRLSDKWGRRPIMLTSICFSGLGHLLFGLSGTMTVVVMARLLAGFGTANLGTAQAIISDTTTHENRAKGMGLIGAAFGLGFLFGPAIGGFAGQYSPQAPALVAAGLAVVNFLLAYFMLPETKSFQENETSKGSHHRTKIFSVSDFRQATKLINVPSLLKISLINTAAFAMFEVVVSLLMERSYLPIASRGTQGHIAEAAKLTAWFLVCVGITAVIIQGGLIGRLNKFFGEVKLIRTGLLIMGISVFLMPIVSGNYSYDMMLLLAVTLACGSGILNPSQSSLLSKSVPIDQQGSIFGLNQSMSALGRVIGPAVSGYLFEINLGLPFYASGFLSIIALLISLTLIDSRAQNS